MINLFDKVTLMLIVTLCVCTNSNAQDDVEDKIYNYVSKNIIAYTIKTSQIFDVENKINVDTRLYFDLLIPNFGSKLMVDISKHSEQKYPNKNYILYSIKRYGFGMIDIDSGKTRVPIGLPIKSNNSNYLIGYDVVNDKIIFISGDFYLTKITSDFNLNVNNPETFLKLIELRFYKLNVTEIQFEKETSTYLEYSIKSHLLNGKNSVRIMKNDFESMYLVPN